MKTLMAVAALALGLTISAQANKADSIRRVRVVTSMQDSVVESALLRRLRAIKDIEVVGKGEAADYYLSVTEASITVQGVLKGYALSLATVVTDNQSIDLRDRLYILGAHSFDSQLDNVVADFDVSVLEPDRKGLSQRSQK